MRARREKERTKCQNGKTKAAELTDWLNGNEMGEWQINNWNIKRRREGGEHGKAKWNQHEMRGRGDSWTNWIWKYRREGGRRNGYRLTCVSKSSEAHDWMTGMVYAWLKHEGFPNAEREGSHVVSKGKKVGRSAGEGKKNEGRKTRNIASYGREFRNERKWQFASGIELKECVGCLERKVQRLSRNYSRHRHKKDGNRRDANQSWDRKNQKESLNKMINIEK